MASIHQQIREASAWNASLLSGLHDTKSAPSQLSDQIQYIRELDTQLLTAEKALPMLKYRSLHLQKIHEDHSKSKVRRFAHTAFAQKSRFEAKTSAEEKQYQEALAKQTECEEKIERVKSLKVEAEVSKLKYSVEATRNAELQKELDALYESIFSGPTPAYPEDDENEKAWKEAQRNVSAISQMLQLEQKVLKLLREAEQKLKDAKQNLAKAHSASRHDMLGGGTHSSMSKLKNLERAESAVALVRMLQERIQEISPDRANLGMVNIPAGSIWKDVVFDNIFTDLNMHEKIKRSEDQVERALKGCSVKVKEAAGNERNISALLGQAKKEEREKRAGLQRCREGIFERVGRGMIGGEEDGMGVGIVKGGETVAQLFTDAGPFFPQPPAYSS